MYLTTAERKRNIPEKALIFTGSALLASAAWGISQLGYGISFWISLLGAGVPTLIWGCNAGYLLTSLSPKKDKRGFIRSEKGWWLVKIEILKIIISSAACLLWRNGLLKTFIELAKIDTLHRVLAVFIVLCLALTILLIGWPRHSREPRSKGPSLQPKIISPNIILELPPTQADHFRDLASLCTETRLKVTWLETR